MISLYESSTHLLSAKQNLFNYNMCWLVLFIKYQRLSMRVPIALGHFISPNIICFKRKIANTSTHVFSRFVGSFFRRTNTRIIRWLEKEKQIHSKLVENMKKKKLVYWLFFFFILLEIFIKNPIVQGEILLLSKKIKKHSYFKKKYNPTIIKRLLTSRKNKETI